MSAETELYAAIQSQVGGRMYPEEAPANPTTPYIVYNRSGATPEIVLSQVAPVLNAVALQVAIWDKTLAGATVVRDNVITALASSAVVYNGDEVFLDPQSLDYRVLIDVTFWET
jgi:hypothetical protein